MSSEKILRETICCNSDDLILKWNNLTSSVQNINNNTVKNILNNVSGSVKSTSFTAILGPSGAGKTTLLEGISCRSSSVQGAVTVNGYFMNNAIMKEISGFLPQHDIAFDCLTTEEYLQFTCTMKMHKILNAWDRKLKVENIIHKFGLEKCANTQIIKLSGGERRRLFLGTALLADPPIIFCDEPTTGLDSYNALEIVSTLRNISLSGKIIIISIHQPSSDIIKYFDNFILLSVGTVISYGNQERITSFFNSLDIICPETCNIAEFYIKQISVIPGEEEDCVRKINYFHTEFLKTKTPNNICGHPVYMSINFEEKLKCSYYMQFLWLFWRETILLRQEIASEIISFLVLIITAILIALFYSSTDNNFEKIQNLNGILYLIVSELLFTATYSVLHKFPHEIPIFKSEKDLYSSTIYYLVKICSKIPHIFIYPYSFMLILYLIVPLHMDINLYLNIGFVLCFASSAAYAYGFLLSTLSDSTDYINLIIVPMDTIFLLTSGIFLKLDTLPFILTWIKYISSFFYSFEAISTLYWNHFLISGCPSNVPCRNNTEFEENYMQYVNNNYYYDVYSLIILTVVMHSIGCYILIRKRKKYYKRK